MATANNSSVAIFYEKRLHGSLLGHSVECASLSWSDFTGVDVALMNQLREGHFLFVVVSCEWLSRDADILIHAIRSRYPTVRIILCCVQPTIPSTLYPLIMSADPDVFCHFTELTTCLQALIDGRSFVSAHLWADTNERPHVESLLGWNNLSKQEHKVLRLMAEGYKGPDIAKKLFISPYTVNNHKAKIIEKLNVSGGPGSLMLFVMAKREKILASK